MQNVEKRIVIFKNTLEARENSDPAKRPDFRGNVVVNNKTIYLSLWKHEKDGSKSIGGKAQEKGDTTDCGDIFIKAATDGSKHLLEGNITVHGTQYDVKLYGRKSEKIGVYWEGKIEQHKMVEENDTEELPF